MTVARNSILFAIKRLAGYQAIGLDEAFRLLLGGRGDADLMPVVSRKALCDVLRKVGYREIFVIKEGCDDAQLMWVRHPWPTDIEALQGRKIEKFLSM